MSLSYLRHFIYFTILLIARSDSYAQTSESDVFPTEDGNICSCSNGTGIFGLTTLYILPNFSSLNPLLSDLHLPALGNWFILYGAEVHAGAGGFRIKNGDLTFHISAGSRSTTGHQIIGGRDYTRTVSVSHIQYGLQPGYVICLLKNLMIIPGVMLGQGINRITISQTADKTNFQQIAGQQAFEGPGTSSIIHHNRHAVIYRNDIFVMPEATFQYIPNSFLALRMRVGYRSSIMSGEWEDDSGIEILMTPDFQLVGPVIQLTAVFGLFTP